MSAGKRVPREPTAIKTMAQIIGVPEDPVVEEVRKLFYNGAAAIEQACKQRNPPSPIEMRRREWGFAAQIVGIVDRMRAAPDADAGPSMIYTSDAEQAIQDALKALYNADIDETDKRKIEQHLINADAGALASRRKYDDHLAALERRIEILSDNLRWVLPMAKGWAHDHPVGSNAEIVAGAEAILRGDADA